MQVGDVVRCGERVGLVLAVERGAADVAWYSERRGVVVLGGADVVALAPCDPLFAPTAAIIALHAWSEALVAGARGAARCTW